MSKTIINCKVASYEGSNVSLAKSRLCQLGFHIIYNDSKKAIYVVLHDYVTPKESLTEEPGGCFCRLEEAGSRDGCQLQQQERRCVLSTLEPRTGQGQAREAPTESS